MTLPRDRAEILGDASKAREWAEHVHGPVLDSRLEHDALPGQDVLWLLHEGGIWSRHVIYTLGIEVVGTPRPVSERMSQG